MVKTEEIIQDSSHTLKEATKKIMLKIKTRRHPGMTKPLNPSLYAEVVNKS